MSNLKRCTTKFSIFFINWKLFGSQSLKSCGHFGQILELYSSSYQPIQLLEYYFMPSIPGGLEIFLYGWEGVTELFPTILLVSPNSHGNHFNLMHLCLPAKNPGYRLPKRVKKPWNLIKRWNQASEAPYIPFWIAWTLLGLLMHVQSCSEGTGGLGHSWDLGFISPHILKWAFSSLHSCICSPNPACS